MLLKSFIGDRLVRVSSKFVNDSCLRSHMNGGKFFMLQTEISLSCKQWLRGATLKNTDSVRFKLS